MPSTVIVALPSEDDYVNKISSEKKPHLTLLYLGEDFAPENLSEVVKYVRHVANTSIERFGLSVDHRGTLGDKDADVLFFNTDDWHVNKLKDIIGYFLANSEIANAYNKEEQFPKWIPHMTLGYPDTPANPDPRDYPGLTYVTFNRIAFWTGEYEGPEFHLDFSSNDVLHSEEQVEALVKHGIDFMTTSIPMNDSLQHYGIKGMRWGVRRDRTATGVDLKTVPGKRVKASGGKYETASEDAKRTATQKRIAKKSSTDALSNQELKQLVERMQLEAKYDRLVHQQRGNAIVRKLLTNPKFREQTVNNISDLGTRASAPVRNIRGVQDAIARTDLTKIGK